MRACALRKSPTLSGKDVILTHNSIAFPDYCCTHALKDSGLMFSQRLFVFSRRFQPVQRSPQNLRVANRKGQLFIRYRPIVHASLLHVRAAVGATEVGGAAIQFQKVEVKQIDDNVAQVSDFRTDLLARYHNCCQ